MELTKYMITIRSEKANDVEMLLSENGVPFSKVTICDSCEQFFDCDESGSGFCEKL